MGIFSWLYRGPKDGQTKGRQAGVKSSKTGLVQDLLVMLKEEQHRNKDLTKAVLDIVKDSKTEGKVIVAREPVLSEHVEENKPKEVYSPELNNIYFDTLEDKDVECNFDELSESETISETGISDDKMEKLRNLVKKEV